MKKSTTLFIPAVILLLGYALGLLTSLETTPNMPAYVVLNLFGITGAVLLHFSEKARRVEQVSKLVI